MKLPEADGPKVLADLWSLPDGGLLAMTSDGLYDCHEGAEKHVFVQKGDSWVPLTGGKDPGRVRAALAE